MYPMSSRFLPSILLFDVSLICGSFVKTTFFLGDTLAFTPSEIPELIDLGGITVFPDPSV